MRDPVLTARAKAMRREMLEPELRLWLPASRRALRRRESSAGRRSSTTTSSIWPPTIRKLVVEIDGDTHAKSGPTTRCARDLRKSGLHRRALRQLRRDDEHGRRADQVGRE